MAALKNPQNDKTVRSHCRQEEKRCSETSALHAIHVQPVADGASHVKTGLHWFDIRRAWSQGEWSLLPWHSAAVTYACGHTSHRRRVLHISAGQCSGAPGSWDDLERKTPGFILPDFWPLNSWDFNSVDYKVWDLMQHQVNQTKVQDVDDLRQRRWKRMEQGVNDDAIDEWRRCLRACVQAKGGHFEYSQWLVNLFILFCENLSITFIVNQHNLGQSSVICFQ